MHKKLTADSVTLKDLIAFVVASNLTVAFFVFSGGLDVIENWERKKKQAVPREIDMESPFYQVDMRTEGRFHPPEK